MDPRARGTGFQPGHVIADKYQLEALVGEGGMGSVWRARHVQLESAVALKLMSPAIASQPEALQRFLREARAAARLSSLHVVKVFDFGVDGDTPFIAMELLQGESLRQRLDRVKVLGPEATLWVLRQAGRALAKAHAQGIVHRDLKPENLFVTQQEDELLKVLDFGVAKLAGGAAGHPSTNTRTGALLGTPFYMSPEQARGIKTIDHRSDIWSLGVIAFECLTGRLPFESQAFGDLVLKICTLPPPVPSSVAPVPPGFDAWFARATEREPEQRYQTVEELVEGLRALVQANSNEAAPGSVAARANTEPAPRPLVTRTDVTATQSLVAGLPRRGFARRIALWSGLAAVAAAGAWFAVAQGEPRQQRPGTRAERVTASAASASSAARAPEPATVDDEGGAGAPSASVTEAAAGEGGASALPASALEREASSPSAAAPAESEGAAVAAPLPAAVAPPVDTTAGEASAAAAPAPASSPARERSVTAPTAPPRRNAPSRSTPRPASPRPESSRTAPAQDLFSEPD